MGAIALVVVGCGAEAPRAKASLAQQVPRDAGADGGDAAVDGSSDLLPSAARIAEGGAAIAPGMREILRFEADAPATRALVQAAERDTCARVAFAADAPVVLTFADGGGATLAETPRAASGVSSTVCVRRGEAIVVRVRGDHDAGVPTRVRAVAWVAP